ncbi:hypothetical protein ACSSS7_003287 [Eimeria intestinalis]
MPWALPLDQALVAPCRYLLPRARPAPLQRHPGTPRPLPPFPSTPLPSQAPAPRFSPPFEATPPQPSISFNGAGASSTACRICTNFPETTRICGHFSILSRWRSTPAPIRDASHIMIHQLHPLPDKLSADEGKARASVNYGSTLDAVDGDPRSGVHRSVSWTQHLPRECVVMGRCGQGRTGRGLENFSRGFLCAVGRAEAGDGEACDVLEVAKSLRGASSNAFLAGDVLWQVCEEGRNHVVLAEARVEPLHRDVEGIRGPIQGLKRPLEGPEEGPQIGVVAGSHVQAREMQ